MVDIHAVFALASVPKFTSTRQLFTREREVRSRTAVPSFLGGKAAFSAVKDRVILPISTPSTEMVSHGG